MYAALTFLVEKFDLIAREDFSVRDKFVLNASLRRSNVLVKESLPTIADSESFNSMMLTRPKNTRMNSAFIHRFNRLNQSLEQVIKPEFFEHPMQVGFSKAEVLLLDG